tara:strand:+ start:3241 stop:3462 length:222 start_codon:yes stop_codon:yes gene_type:complete
VKADLTAINEVWIELVTIALRETSMMVGSAIAPTLFGGMGPAATILLAGGTITLVGGWAFVLSPKLVSSPSAV